MNKKKSFFEKIEDITLRKIVLFFVIMSILVVGYKYYLYISEPKIQINDINYTDEELDRVREDIILESN